MILCVFLVGCQTTPKKDLSRPQESAQEVLGAVGSVTGALTGQEMTSEETRRVMENLQKDKEGQSAMRSISGAMDVKRSGIRYCPVDGKRFSADLVECPEHKIKLKDLVE